MSYYPCFLILFVLHSMFGANKDNLTSISVTEGDSVTLNTNVTDLQRDDMILWIFGARETQIAEIYKHIAYINNGFVIFGDRLQMDTLTGSLMIRNITTELSGLYKLNIIGMTQHSYKRFNVTVYVPLPVPIISRNSTNCSSMSRCSLLCSAFNVSAVSLSWYKGNSLMSSISVSDLSISLSLPLEVEYQEKNTYDCVVNNTISNKTAHLDVSQTCHACADSVHCCGATEAVIRLVVSAIVGVATVAVVVYDLKSERV